MKTLIARSGLLTVIYCSIFAAPSRAHEFIIKPASLHVKAGDKVPFSILSTHVFMSSEELLSSKTVKASLLEGNKSIELSLMENKNSRTLDGIATPSTKGTAIIAGHLLEPVETVTSQETGKQQKARFEKFPKTLIVVESADKNYGKVLGHRLEILPTTDPTCRQNWR